MKKDINIRKVMYCGNGYNNNIGYYVWFEDKKNYGVFIPSLNNTSYDEHYDETIMDEGIHLYKEAESYLKNVFTNNNDTLESYLIWYYRCKKHDEKLYSSIEPDEMV